MTTATTEAPQNMRALAEANRIRLARANYKRKLATTAYPATLREAAALISDPPSELFTMRVYELVLSCRQLGTRKAERLLRPALLSPQRRTIGDLTPAERRRVITALEQRADGHCP